MSMHAYSEKGSRDETLLLLAVAAGRLLEGRTRRALTSFRGTVTRTDKVQFIEPHKYLLGLVLVRRTGIKKALQCS